MPSTSTQVAKDAHHPAIAFERTVTPVANTDGRNSSQPHTERVEDGTNRRGVIYAARLFDPHVTAAFTRSGSEFGLYGIVGANPGQGDSPDSLL